MNYTDVYLGLGSNVGSRASHLAAAVQACNEDRNIHVIAESSVIETEPIGNTNQGPFLNQVIRIETDYCPVELLGRCLEIEASRGRIRVEKWGPRTLDIDILFFGTVQCKEDGLEIPHPEACKRDFVMMPLSEIAPTFRHPVTGHDIGAMLHVL
jgi:2-amino-4-hydroxy-6-hydroxymethyldihydropteridine diphosphokinase